MDNLKIIEKIKKLLRLSENNPNINEAMSAATMAQELMDRYRIDYELVVTGKESEKKEPIIDFYQSEGTFFSFVKNPTPWVQALMNVCADNNNCKVYITQFKTPSEDGWETFSGFSIIGRPSDIGFTGLLFQFLFIQILAIEARSAKNEDPLWKDSWRFGAVSKIKTKLESRNKKDEAFKNQYTKEQLENAIIKIDEYKNEVEKMFENMSLSETEKHSSKNLDGFKEGFKAAEIIILNENKEFENSKTKELQ